MGASKTNYTFSARFHVAVQTECLITKYRPEPRSKRNAPRPSLCDETSPDVGAGSGPASLEQEAAAAEAERGLKIQIECVVQALLVQSTTS